jgi:hypothetical protein
MGTKAAWAAYRPQTLGPEAAPVAPGVDAPSAARAQGLTALQAALNNKRWDEAALEAGLSCTRSDVGDVVRIVVVWAIAHSAVAD